MSVSYALNSISMELILVCKKFNKQFLDNVISMLREENPYKSRVRLRSINRTPAQVTKEWTTQIPTKAQEFDQAP